MDTILIQPANMEEMEMIKDFLDKSHIKSRLISDEEKEDLVLGLLMQETDYNDIVDTEEFIKNLQKK
jgi:hypothetical protein